MGNPFFNAAYYLTQNPDVAAAGYTLATAEQHYDQYGAAELRALTPWFDATAYLTAYSDLAINGITAATAFHHYVTYGLGEGRLPAPNVDPIQFSYVDYATSNPDLQAAFGINNPAHLTTDQQHALLAHFLSYGYLEDRAGIESVDSNSFFAAFDHTPQDNGPGPVADMEILIDHRDTYTSADGNDVFTGTQQYLNGSLLNGKGGQDALNANFDQPTAASVAVNSIENIKVDFDHQYGTLNVTTTNTQSLSIILTNSGIGSTSAMTFAGDNSNALHTILVDGSAMVGNTSLSIDGLTLPNVDATIIGGSGGDRLTTTVGIDHTATLNGGDGGDRLVASAGQDILTGGSGGDYFDFSNGGGVRTDAIHGDIVRVDSIEDFDAADFLSATGAIAGTSSESWGNVNNGIVHFGVIGTTPPATLTEAVSDLDAYAQTRGPGPSQFLFQFNSETYFLNTGAIVSLMADDTLIKLTGGGGPGGIDLNDLVLSATSVTYNPT